MKPYEELRIFQLTGEFILGHANIALSKHLDVPNLFNLQTTLQNFKKHTHPEKRKNV